MPIACLTRSTVDNTISRKAHAQEVRLQLAATVKLPPWFEELSVECAGYSTVYDETTMILAQ